MVHTLKVILVMMIVWCVQANKKCYECVSDLEAKDCKPGYFFREKITVGDCCPGCKELKDRCVSCRDTSECGDGLMCNTEIRLCVPNIDSCFAYKHLVEKKLYPPTCLPDGTFAPVQCKGDRVTGRCFCANKYGTRIFGNAWISDAKDMTCACSRRRAELEEDEGRIDVTLHCTPKGNYEALQCDSGLCWCAEEKTGDPISVVLPEDLVSQLPCYDSNEMGSQYTRLCESKAHGISLLKNKLAVHGTLQVTMEKVFCDYDGTYGIFQISQGIAYCSWRDGSRIGNWQIEAGASLGDVNCNCARDSKYFDEVNKTKVQDCSGNGNYMPKQQLNGQVYCVDGDGFPLTKLYDLGVDFDCTTIQDVYETCTKKFSVGDGEEVSVLPQEDLTEIIPVTEKIVESKT